MTKAFTKATGIPVQLDDNSTGPLLTQIEASKNNPKWGLLVGGRRDRVRRPRHAGPAAEGLRADRRLELARLRVVPSDKSYVPTGVTLMGILAYNKTKVDEPADHLAGSSESATWKGQVGMNDPSQSGPTFPLIAGVMNYLGGVSAGEKYFSTLKANGLIIHPTNGPTPAGADQRPDQPGAGAVARRRSARRSPTRTSASST